MGDDFDLFPKRENLDPFSFKTKEKKPEQPEKPEDLFGTEDQAPSPPDTTPPDLSPEKPPADQQPEADAAGVGTFPPLEPPPSPEKQPEPVPVLEPEGPISEGKTFDEPDDETMPLPEDQGKKKRKTQSPFIVIGGALIIIIGLLYLALTFLKSDKPPVPTVPLPEASVSVEPPPSAPVPVPEPEEPKQVTEPEEGAAGKTVAVATPSTETAETGPPEQEVPAAATEGKEPAAPEPVEDKSEKAAAVAAATVAESGGRYSVQTGAFILQTSVRELEKKMDSLGYETFRKEGSTTALMNMLSVGPFSTVERARKAVSDLNGAGIEANLVRRSEGGAIVNAGSYLLDENARNIERKIINLGYQVKLVKKEAKLPMTFVRTGRFEELSDAARLRDELKEKGLDAIVVKLQ